MFPLLKKNLLSVRRFTYSNNVFFEFHCHILYVKDLNTRTILSKGQIKMGFLSCLHQKLPPHSKLSLLVNGIPLTHGIVDLGIPLFDRFATFYFPTIFPLHLVYRLLCVTLVNRQNVINYHFLFPLLNLLWMVIVLRYLLSKISVNLCGYFLCSSNLMLNTYFINFKYLINVSLG